MKKSMIEGSNIRSMCTRFSLNEDHLSYQIVLQYHRGENMISQIFDRFEEYRTTHDLLVDAMNNDRSLLMEFNPIR